MYQDPILAVAANSRSEAAVQPESRGRGAWFPDLRQMLRGGSGLYCRLLSRPGLAAPLPPALSLFSQCHPIQVAGEASPGNQDPRQPRGSSSALSQVNSQSTPVAEPSVLVVTVAHPAAAVVAAHSVPFGSTNYLSAATACRIKKGQQAEKWLHHRSHQTGLKLLAVAVVML